MNEKLRKLVMYTKKLRLVGSLSLELRNRRSTTNLNINEFEISVYLDFSMLNSFFFQHITNL